MAPVTRSSKRKTGTTTGVTRTAKGSREHPRTTTTKSAGTPASQQGRSKAAVHQSTRPPLADPEKYPWVTALACVQNNSGPTTDEVHLFAMLTNWHGLMAYYLGRSPSRRVQTNPSSSPRGTSAFPRPQCPLAALVPRLPRSQGGSPRVREKERAGLVGTTGRINQAQQRGAAWRST